MEEEKPIVLDKVVKSSELEEIKYKVSANYLSNFMRKREYLEDTIKRMAFIPRYCYENLEYMNLLLYDEKIKGIFIPMVCFCDIPLHQIAYHAAGEKGYGKFGIALTKEWGKKNDLQNIHYVNEGSKFLKQFENTMNMIIQNLDQEKSKLFDTLSDSMLEHLQYMKPNYGTMKKEIDSQSKTIKKNFHDEREWRYIPRFNKQDLPQIIIEPKDSKLLAQEVNGKKLTNAISEIPSSFLNFSVTDVKYIFVETDKDRRAIIDCILGIDESTLSKDEKLILISKIIVYSDFEEDI